VRGRTLAAKGPLALKRESVISQEYKKALKKLCKLSMDHKARENPIP
jgi:hypothetical protein